MWIPVVMLVVIALIMLVAVGPILKLFGIVDWQWKVILGPILVPLTALFVWLLGWALFWGFFLALLAFIAK
jgi:hypothetical protein